MSNAPLNPMVAHAGATGAGRHIRIIRSEMGKGSRDRLVVLTAVRAAWDLDRAISSQLRATHIVRALDTQLGPSWNCVVGRDLNLRVRQLKGTYCHLGGDKDIQILVFKCAPDMLDYVDTAECRTLAEQAEDTSLVVPKHVSMLSTGMAAQMAQSVQRLAVVAGPVGTAAEAAGSSDEAFLKMFKALLTRELGATWHLVLGPLSTDFVVAAASDTLTKVTDDESAEAPESGAGSDGGAQTGAGAGTATSATTVAGDAVHLTFELRVTRRLKVFGWRATGVDNMAAAAVTPQKRVTGALYFIAFALLMLWFYARGWCDEACAALAEAEAGGVQTVEEAEAEHGPCTGGPAAVSDAAECTRRVTYLLYGAVAVFCLAPAMRVGRRLMRLQARKNLKKMM